MDITFIYNGKTITTPNLEKKLKRMKITKDDIQIIDNIKPKIVNDEYKQFKNHIKTVWLNVNEESSLYGEKLESFYEREQDIPIEGRFISEWKLIEKEQL